MTETGKKTLAKGSGNTRVEIRVEDDRTGMDPATLERAMLDHLYYSCIKDEASATGLHLFQALSWTVRDRLVQRWLKTQQTYRSQDVKRVYYLSAEFLLGRLLSSNLINLGQWEMCRSLLAQYGIDLADVLEEEEDPGLGNGGLGRLAACFLDSMATLELPGYGYGIRYEFGIFRQLIRDGWQIEQADAWLRHGNPWEIARHEFTVPVNFYGHVEQVMDDRGVLRVSWIDTQKIMGVPYDTPIAGYDNNTVNTLRLWSARASRDFNLQVFNDGDFRRAVEEKALGESISKILYPNDKSVEGRELRLKQQYFFTCCSIHDIIRRYKKTHDTFDAFSDKVAIQLNDTHPSIAVAELMRKLVDEEGLGWEQAWSITNRSVAFTNHTLLSEALERWPVEVFERLLPRHLQIIFEINHRFLRQVHIHAPNDHARQRRMSIIEEGEERQVRMAHLAVVGSHSVNGVAALHTELVREQLLPDFVDLWPERFNNKTNGVTPRRWILQANPALAAAITARIGAGWVKDLDQLEGLAPLVEDEEFLVELQGIKRANKARLAALIKAQHGQDVNLEAIFDVQVKRIHQYKRQLLNALHVVSLYLEIKGNPNAAVTPRVFVIGGKAAPGYAMAKLQIKLINDIAAIVNNDPAMRGRLKLFFMANYGVSMAEVIIPGTDVSEQISMAGKEASGTGNMKFAMNGALTVGTLDGANVEIREAVGDDNFFLFGLTVGQVKALKNSGYDPQEYIDRSPRLKAALDLIASGFFSPDDPQRFRPIIQSLRHEDAYLHCADFDDYVACQQRVAEVWADPMAWTRHVVHNLARVGRFSSDRTIRQYAAEIWGIHPVKVTL